jgi:hypothetical protein
MHRKPVHSVRSVDWRGLTATTALLAGFSPLALASDFSGVITILFGIPTLLVLNVILGLMLLNEPSARVRLLIGILGFPSLAAGFLLWGDAASLFRTRDTVPWAVFYFSLYALAVALVARHFLRRPTLEGGSGN